MARQAESRTFRTFHFALHANREAEHRKEKQYAERKNLATRVNGDGRTEHHHAGKQRTQPSNTRIAAIGIVNV